MHQALHIFRKDVRHLRYEIGLALALIAVFAWIQVRALGLPGGSGLADLLVLVTTGFLIARVVHAEALPGDRQFWITRPYRWKSLLGAKLLFMVTFANLPVLVTHILILTIGGFPLASGIPGLLWSQVMLTAYVWLPIGALASVTSRLASFLFADLILLAVVFGLSQVLLETGQGWPAGVDWIRSAVLFCALVAVAVPVLYEQYKNRRSTFSRVFALSGAVAGTAVYLLLPWPLAFAVQSRLSPEPMDGSVIQLALAPEMRRAMLALPRQEVQLELPLALRGAPDEADLQANALAVRFDAPDGSAWKSPLTRMLDLTRQHRGQPILLDRTFLMDRSFFNRERDNPLRLRVSLYLTVFGRKRAKTIPVQAEFVNVMDGLQCNTLFATRGWDVYCRSAFRWPARAVYARIGDTETTALTQFISYSPFPAGLNLSPVGTAWAPVYTYGEAPPADELEILVKEPIAHFRRDFEIPDVRLADFAVPQRRRVVVRGGRAYDQNDF